MGRARKLIRRFRKDRLFHERVRLRVGTAFDLGYALVKFVLAWLVGATSSHVQNTGDEDNTTESKGQVI